MKVDDVLLRFGELTLKGKNRRMFEDKALEQVKRVLKSFPQVEIEKTYDRIYVRLNGTPFQAVADQLKKVFGLASFSPVIRCTLSLDEIRRAALETIQNMEPRPRTFKVKVKRAYKAYEHTSLELNHLIGGYVLKNVPGLKVDVHHPEAELQVEIRKEGAFVYSEVIEAPGGFPVGSSGKAMLMLSGGIDSPVAGWLAMKRGVEIEAVHFHSFPYTSERAQQKVIDLTRKLAEYGGTIRLHMVPFTDIQIRLNQSKRNHLLITLMRRAMVRISEKLAEQNGALAIITGDSLGQVASQTLASINVIGRVTHMPILRPLIAMDKQEIIELAERIETYPISILPYEDCCTLFVPKTPSTNPNLGIVERIERGIPELESLIEQAVLNTETMDITPEEVAAETSHLF